MATSASIAGWPEVLSQLDRHGSRRQLSPDVAGLVDLMNLYRVPGLGIAVAQDGERRWAAEYSTVAADAATPIGPRTVFQACSISMHVAAFGALRFNALLTNAVIFHNALDIAEIVRQLQEEGYVVDPEDLAHISPYLTEHIRRFGEYSTHELDLEPEAYDPHLDVDFSPLRGDGPGADGYGQAA